MTVRCLVVGLALASCSNPSVIDDLGGGIPASALTWRQIEERAEPMSSRLDLLRSATRGPRETPAEVAQRCDELIAWMDARGTVLPPPLMASFNDLGVDGLLALTRACLAARPADDRMFETLLYTAARLRGDGVGIVDSMIAAAITRQLAKHRPVPPAFASKYAPTDAEVFRMFAAEALFVRRAMHEIGQDGGPDLALHVAISRAPLERNEFLAHLASEVAARPDASFYAFAKRQFEEVDAYRAWLVAGVSAP